MLNIVDIVAMMAAILLPFAIIIRLCDLLWGESAVKKRLNRLWEYFSNRSVTDSPARIAQITFRLHKRIFGNRLFSCRGLAVSFFISCTLTTLAILIGRIIETGEYLSVYESLYQTAHSLIPLSRGFYKSEYLFSFKFIFDYLILSLTMRCARQIYEKNGFFSRMRMICLNLFFASVFAFTSLFGIKVVSCLSRNQEFGGPLVFSAYEKAVHTISTFISCEGKDFDSFLFSITAFLPALLYLLLLGLVTIMHLADGLIHKISIRLGERFIFVKIPILLSLVLLIYSLAEVIEWLLR